MSEAAAKPADALPLFEAFLTARGMQLESMVARDGIDAMLDFFRTQRFEFRGSDWLLFQYGPEWDGGRYFDLDITRQLAVDQEWELDEDAVGDEADVTAGDQVRDLNGEHVHEHVHEHEHDEEHAHDDGVWQLSLTFRIPATPALNAIKSANRWCESDAPDAVTAFETFIRTSAPYLAAAEARPARVDLTYEDAC